jgi:TetR/AcrR family transcriptional regulator of autoinduction and epiphytic fitness
MAAVDRVAKPERGIDDITGGGDVDPRKLRSRARLLDAATSLLVSGGVEAVTVDAVTRMSKVARTTLYRHFSSSTHLLAAAFERLLPQVTPPPPTGDLRQRLIELLNRQAALIDEAPLHLTALAWLALGPGDPGGDCRKPLAGLSTRVIEQYRQPFDALLTCPEARAELRDLDITLAIIQLVGPVVFAKLTGMRTLTSQDRIRIVDDFLHSHRLQSKQNRPQSHR